MLFEMQDILFEFYRDMPNGKVLATPINRSNFRDSFHSFGIKILKKKLHAIALIVVRNTAEYSTVVEHEVEANSG